MPGRKFVSGEGYRFGFNGKEDDLDRGTQDIIDANLDVVKYWGGATSWTQDNMCPEYLDVLWGQKHYFDLRIDYVDQYPQYGDGWASWANHLGTMDKNVGVWFAPLERHVKATRRDLYPNSSSYTPQNGTDYKVETPK
ncbi:hypothetical protein SapgrDRAFT_0078 [Saprospira grandis DSM 2844]|uniref:Uncharacterized protein n=1 Tax=Saprospira grandis DSM 2844 TaxID=694433 RepID=J0NWG2_9BACT|nr:hypothetical protein [Saprospira grandis]EJF51839.1 hypothetical protein SapgrDRAFT_0078 [Saprospira grandis DSM 2844]